jgi:hypothetical protein
MGINDFPNMVNILLLFVSAGLFAVAVFVGFYFLNKEKNKNALNK